MKNILAAEDDYRISDHKKHTSAYFCLNFKITHPPAVNTRSSKTAFFCLNLQPVFAFTAWKPLALRISS